MLAKDVDFPEQKVAGRLHHAASQALPWRAASFASNAPSPSQTAPSLGSQWHHQGFCKPCTWFWKVQGCRNGDTCWHCHLCPEGARRDLKKLRKAAWKQEPMKVAIQSPLWRAPLGMHGLSVEESRVAEVRELRDMSKDLHCKLPRSPQSGAAARPTQPHAASSATSRLAVRMERARNGAGGSQDKAATFTQAALLTLSGLS